MPLCFTEDETSRRSPLNPPSRNALSASWPEGAFSFSAWIEANGYEYAGPMFDIYHVSPHETSDPSEFVTEVCYPVRKK